MTGVDVTGLDQYVATFRSRAAVLGGELLDSPGLLGCSLRRHDVPVGRLLVVSDAAVAVLEGRLLELDVEMVTVLGDAPRAIALLEGSGRFRLVEEGTAMVREHLDDLPASELPDGLRLTPVQRTPDEPDGVPFEVALAASGEFDPDDGVSDEVIRDFLMRLPHGRLLAAVDDDGAVHATSASGAYGEDAVVVFVTTDPAWRRRGVGSTMTARALEAAREEGALRASLDASALGEPIYRRLGFSSIGTINRFAREG